MTQDQADIAPIPGGSCIGGWLLAMNAKSEHKDGAWEFLDYFTSLEGQRIFCSKGGYVPGFNDALEDADVKAANQLLGKEGFMKALENTIARPSSGPTMTSQEPCPAGEMTGSTAKRAKKCCTLCF